MNAAHQASRRRRPLLIVLSVALVIALVIAAILWRDRFGDGQQEAEDLAAALPEGDFADEADVAEHQRILGPLIEATGQAPQVELADAGSAEDGQRTATLEWTWTLPEEAGTWEYTTEATLRRGDDGWSAELDPEVFAPDLEPREHLDLQTLEPQLGTVTDRDGQELYGPHPVKVLGVDKTQIDEDEQGDAARELAGLLGTDADRYAQTVADRGPGAFGPALTIPAAGAGGRPPAAAGAVPGRPAAAGSTTRASPRWTRPPRSPPATPPISPAPSPWSGTTRPGCSAPCGRPTRRTSRPPRARSSRATWWPPAAWSPPSARRCWARAGWT